MKNMQMRTEELNRKKNRVENGQISLSEEHYEFVSKKAESYFWNRDRYPSGYCTVEGRSGPALAEAKENRRKFREYHLNADENLVLEEIINFYLVNKTQNNTKKPQTWN